ncbi:MAG: hypothetical protein U0441_26585 [Polyangiaceae bacterium]
MSRWLPPWDARMLGVLRHPLFLLALVTLVVNDHWLKGARILPGVVTGKLSDFAGLVVAPVLLATLLGARTNARRAAAFGLVAAPFAAIKLSAGAAQLLVSAAGLAGLRLRIWTDPTDLAALVSLWPAWQLCTGALARQGRAGQQACSRATWLLERAVMGVSALACVATSANPGPGTYYTTAYLLNTGPDAVDVRVRWVDAKLDCPTVMGGDPTRFLGPNAFNLGVTFHLEHDATAPLDRAAAYMAAGLPDPGATESGEPVTGGSCEVALVESDLIPATLLFWDGLTGASIVPNVRTAPEFWRDDATLPGRVVVAPGALATPGSVKQGPLQKTVPPGSCADVSQSSYQWSVPVEILGGAWILSGVEEKSDGCLALDLTDPQSAGNGGAGGMGGSGGMGGAGGGGAAGGAGDPGTLPTQAYLCIPKEELPFAVGTHLAFATDETAVTEASSPKTLTIKDVASTKTLEVHQRKAEVKEGGLAVHAEVGTCVGDRIACGGYVTPAVILVQASNKLSTLKPGESLSGAGFRVRLGRAELIPVARTDCEDGYRTPSISADFLVSYE